MGATVRNLVVLDVYIFAFSNQQAGVVFGSCKNCSLSNIFLSTSNSSLSNQVIAGQTVGGMVGCFINSSITNCTVQNTLAKSTNFFGTNSGGFIGYASSIMMQFCFNLGFSSNSGAVLAYSTYITGGLIGTCDRGSIITQSGVERGEIKASNYSPVFFNFPQTNPKNYTTKNFFGQNKKNLDKTRFQSHSLVFHFMEKKGK